MAAKFGRHSSQRNFRRSNKGNPVALCHPLYTRLLTHLPSQTFRGRLVEVIDQAQHFAALGPSGGGGPTGDSAQAFREGLDGTERECECQTMCVCYVKAESSFLSVVEWLCSICIGAGECEADETVVRG
jgi:hypothetical protein